MIKKVLILDDCQSFAEELEKSLDEYQVIASSDSNYAIDISLLEKPDLFICDWQLDHGNNGLVIREVLKCICPELKVLFISAYSCYDLRENLKYQKNTYFLAKPFCKKTLLEQIKTIDSRKLEQDASIIPVAIVKIGANEELFAYNQLANKIPLHEITIENIHSTRWTILKLQKQNFLARKRICSSSTFLILIDIRNEMLVGDPRFEYFLTGKIADDFNSEEKMLVIDRHHAIRSLASEIMNENMVFCHTAISIDEGLEILEKDKLIKTVVVDSSFDQTIINKLINTVKKKGTNIKIVGAFASSQANSSELKFDSILSKPFSAENLVNVFYEK